MEVEIKVRVTDEEFERIKKTVSSLGRFVERRSEKDVYFNHPCRDFRKTDEALRLRDDGSSFRMTYKGPKVDYETKAREELDIQLIGENAEKILEKLGFKIAGYVEKEREIYLLGNAVICLDVVNGLGKFIEIEINSDDLDSAKKEIFQILHQFGIEKKRTIRKSYLEMLFN